MKYIFKTIIRNFIREPVTNLINLSGLTISLALVIILSTYCYSELTTDSYHENGDNVFLYLPSDDRIYTPGILKENIDMKVPGVESSLRIAGTWEAPVFKAENRDPVTSDLLFADADFFKFFTYTAIYGDPVSALKKPLTVVITKTLADKLFDQKNALGEIIKLNNNQELTVSAVIEEPKANSCLSISAVASMATQKIIQGDGGEFSEWGWCDFQTFILLSDKTNPGETEKTILSLFPEDFRKDYRDAKLVPLREVYFSGFMLYGNDYLLSGDKIKVMLLLMVAVLVLVIALINFINISSSQWMNRIKHTGVLKILGAKRSTILFNVLFESFIFFLAALIISIEIVNSVRSLISDYTGIHYSEHLTYSPGFIILSLSVVLLLSLIISIFPAWRISSSRPADNLKNTVRHEKANFSFRGILVVFQFSIAIVLIAFTILVRKQVRFGSTNLGLNQENIIGIKLTPQLYQKKEVFKNLLIEKPAVSEVSFTQYYPGKDISQWGTTMDINGEKRQLSFETFSADAVFFNILGLHLVSGRFYSDDLSTDKEKVLVNETFLREHNIIDPSGGRFIMGKRNFEIVGVVKDFHYKSVSQPIVSLVIRNESVASYCLVKIRTTGLKSLNSIIQDLKNTASELSPSFPAEVSFFDQAVGNLYQSEIRFQRTFSLFALSAIIICCLGVLAMALFFCQRRVKEIGIRKINGADVTRVLIMLNRDYLKLVAIAFVIAVPVAWYAMQTWLQNFAYKTEKSWWIFLLAGVLALIIAMITVSWNSWKAATRNPVEALRYE